jgi:short-subunit dehydrogenase
VASSSTAERISPSYQLPAAWKVIWITGASTGIGRELALRLAAQNVKVAVSARSPGKLRELEAASANIKAFPLDVSDLEATKAVANAITQEMGAIDLAILNAGVWYPMEVSSFNSTTIQEAMGINYFGVTNALEPLLPAMVARKSGHIAIVASVAGYRGLPVAVSYAPTKAALISLAETLYIDLAEKNVKVTVINPGFVDTPMTKINTFPMPFLISTDRAVDTILKGLIRGKYEIVFPWPMTLLAKFTKMMPHSLFFGFIKLIPGETPPAPPPRAE